MLRLELTIVCA